MRKTYHHPSLDKSTYEALQAWSAYLEKRTDQPVSIAAVVRWLASGKLKIKTEVA